VKWKWPRTALGWKEALSKYIYVVLVIVAGVVLLLMPGGERDSPQAESPAREEAFDLEAFEEKLERALSQVEGVEGVEITAGGRMVSYRSHQLMSAGEAVLWDELADGPAGAPPQDT